MKSNNDHAPARCPNCADGTRGPDDPRDCLTCGGTNRGTAREAQDAAKDAKDERRECLATMLAIKCGGMDCDDASDDLYWMHKD